MIEMVIALAIVGAVAGVIAGLFGVGGGMILVPAFYYAFTTLGYAHQDLMQICLATSLATIVVTSLRSLSAHNKRGGVDWDVLRTWAPGIMIGALVSVAFAAQLRSSTLQWIFGGLGMCIGLYMAFGKTEWRVADDMPAGVRRAIYSPLVGFFSVLMGIGGGSLGVPTMTLHGMTIHRAVATSPKYRRGVRGQSAAWAFQSLISHPHGPHPDFCETETRRRFRVRAVLDSLDR